MIRVLSFLRGVWGRYRAQSAAVKVAVPLVLAILCLLYLLRLEHQATQRAKREADEATFRAEKALVEERRKSAEVKQHAAEVEALIPGLQDEVARLQKVVKGSRPVATRELRTGPLPSAPDAQPPAEPRPGPACPACLFAAGDKGEVVDAGVTLGTDAGAQALVVGALCRRVEPPPATTLFGGLFKPDLSKATRLAPDSGSGSPGWGLGGYGGAGVHGWAAGPAVSLPPLRILGLQFEVTGAVAFGTAGPQGAVVVIGRGAGSP